MPYSSMLLDDPDPTLGSGPVGATTTVTASMNLATSSSHSRHATVILEARPGPPFRLSSPRDRPRYRHQRAPSFETPPTPPPLRLGLDFVPRKLQGLGHAPASTGATAHSRSGPIPANTGSPRPRPRANSSSGALLPPTPPRHHDYDGDGDDDSDESENDSSGILASPTYTHSPLRAPSRARAVEWFAGETNGDGAAHGEDPARAAFERAVDALTKELPPAERTWLGRSNTIDDVQTAMADAMRQYEGRGKECRAFSWLKACSSRILHYGAVFEVVSQHHPEYVSLAWGAFKFLFIAVMQHEELCVEIAKAVARIAHVLPRLELHSDLYPTEHMQRAVAAVYGKIVEFALMAIRWYKKGRLMHSLVAIAKPWSIGYKEIVAEIEELARNVDRVASAASKAEIRHLHGNIHQLNSQVHHLSRIIIAQNALQSRFMIDQKQFFRANQIEDIYDNFVLPSDPSPSTSLAYVRSLRNWRRQKAPPTLPAPQLAKLKAFLAAPVPALLLAQGHGVRTSALDFAADFLDAVIERDFPVLWALPSKPPAQARENIWGDDYDEEGDGDEMGNAGRKAADGGPPTVAGILRSLITQALTLEMAIVSDGSYPVSIKHFRSAKKLDDWFDLFAKCIAGFRRLLIVVDLGLVETAAKNGGDGCAGGSAAAKATYSASFSGGRERKEAPFLPETFVRRLVDMVAEQTRKQETALRNKKGRRGNDGGPGFALLKVVVVGWRSSSLLGLTHAHGDDVFGEDGSRMYTDRGPRRERLARRPKHRAAAKRRLEKLPGKFREMLEEMGGDDGEEEKAEEEEEEGGGETEPDSEFDDRRKGREAGRTDKGKMRAAAGKKQETAKARKRQETATGKQRWQGTRKSNGSNIDDGNSDYD